MDCNGIHSLMDDYLDNLLPAKTRKEFEESIEYCPEQKNILLKHQQLQKRLEDLPLSFTPSESIFEELKDSLLEVEESEIEESDSIPQHKFEKEKKEPISSNGDKKTKTKKSNRRKAILPPIAWTILTVIILSAIIAYYYLYIYNNTAPWKFNLLAGTATVNQTFAERSNIYSGDNIILSEKGRAKLAVPSEFEIELFANSKISILDTRVTSNKIKLIDGSFEFNSLSSESNFIVEHGSFIIEEESGKYSLSTDAYGEKIVKVHNGIIEINNVNYNFRVASNYSFSVKGNEQFTIPVHNDASQKFLTSVNKLNTFINDIAALSTVMIESKQTDALTLLRILELVTSEKRELLYQKVNNIFPPPSGVTKKGILEGNKRMLEKWWSEIESHI